MPEEPPVESKLLTSLEVKAVDTAGRTIEGYAATFGNLDLNGDVIDKKAFDKTLQAKKPADIAVFVGHNSAMLPVGIPVEMRTDAKGLFTKTRIFNTQAGNDLLQTARELQEAGQPLGMSIGFQTRDAKWQTKDGKTYRLLTDADLMEYSYAAKQVIASPPALVTAVKTRKGAAMPGEHEHFVPGEQSVWSTAFIHGLPDSAFAYIEDGGEEIEGKTVPYTLRHFPHHNEDGSVNTEALERELSRAEQSPFRDPALGHLRQHAVAEGVLGDGAKVATAALGEIGATLADLSLEAADVARALTMGQRLGLDGQKVNVRLKGTMKAKLKNIAAALQELISWAEEGGASSDDSKDEGDDGKKSRNGRPSARRALEMSRYAAALAWDGKQSGEIDLLDLHSAIDHLEEGLGLMGGGAGGEQKRWAIKQWDPDNDGDDDSTADGDTDHSHWDESGRQKKPVPGKPLNGESVDEGKARADAALGHFRDAADDLDSHHGALHPEHKLRKLRERKAEWTAAYMNDLPDSSFLWVEDGGEKDDEGKTTPRSLRHFPVKDKDGSVDVAHVRNALARIPQSNAPDAVKSRCISKARAMLSAAGGEPSDGGKTKTRSTDGPGYIAALKEMESTLARYGVSIEA